MTESFTTGLYKKERERANKSVHMREREKERETTPHKTILDQQNLRKLR